MRSAIADLQDRVAGTARTGDEADLQAGAGEIRHARHAAEAGQRRQNLRRRTYPARRGGGRQPSLMELARRLHGRRRKGRPGAGRMREPQAGADEDCGSEGGEPDRSRAPPSRGHVRREIAGGRGNGRAGEPLQAIERRDLRGHRRVVAGRRRHAARARRVELAVHIGVEGLPSRDGTCSWPRAPRPAKRRHVAFRHDFQERLART